MAVELGRFINDQLKNLPPDHPDREYLEDLSAITKSYIEIGYRVRGDFLNRSQLVEREHEALRAFFGKEVPVLTPPSELFETLKVAEVEGFGKILKPVYFPAVKFEQADEYPGWKVKPEEWFWDEIKEGFLKKSAVRLGGYWGLFDESRRPNYNGGRQMFPEDPLAPVLAKARKEGRIAVPDLLNYVPEGSRFAVSSDEKDQTVFPQLAKILRLTKSVAIVRRPTEMEFNFAGNLRYPHLGEANTWEQLNDKWGGSFWLTGGNSEMGGLADVHYDCTYDGCSNVRQDIDAFRPLVVFLHN